MKGIRPFLCDECINTLGKSICGDGRKGEGKGRKGAEEKGGEGQRRREGAPIEMKAP